MRDCSVGTMDNCVVHKCIPAVIFAQNITHCDGKQTSLVTNLVSNSRSNDYFRYNVIIKNYIKLHKN